MNCGQCRRPLQETTIDEAGVQLPVFHCPRCQEYYYRQDVLIGSD